MPGLCVRSDRFGRWRGRVSACVIAGVLTCLALGSATGKDWSDLESRNLTLQECISIARENNPSLARSAAGVRSAEAGVMQAWSGVLPTIRNSSSYYRFDDERLYLTGLRLDQSKVRYSNMLSVQQTLFEGGGNLARISSARSGRGAAQNDYHDSRQDLDLQVKSRYIELLQAKALLSVRQETVDLSQQHVNSAEAFYRAGEKTRADVLRARVELSQNELELISARNAVKGARANLAYVLGVPVGLNIDVDVLPEPGAPVQGDPDADLDEAVKNHPLLRARQCSIRSAKADIRDAKSGRWPSVSASWDYQWNDFAWPRFSGPDHRWGENDEWWFRVSMGFNIFDGRLTKSNIRQAEAGLELASEDYRQALSDIMIGVKQAHLDLIEAEERIRAAGEGVSLAEEDRRLQEERYRLGEGTLLELNDALVALTNARVSKITATYDYHLAEARLDRAVGRD